MICEACGKKEAISFSWFRDFDAKISQPNGVWMLTCMCTANREAYYVMLDGFKKERSQWLAHLSTKTWMDWGDFQRALDKFDLQSMKKKRKRKLSATAILKVARRIQASK